MNEIWLPIKGFKRYHVSSLGNIKSKRRTEKLRIPSMHPKTGYAILSLSKDGIKTAFTVHRLVAKAFIPNPERKETVNHINGIKTDNRVENLEWATRSEQNIHASKMGLKRFNGEDHSQHKLTEDQVRYIRNYQCEGNEVLAAKFGVTKMTISDILRRRSWKHI